LLFHPTLFSFVIMKLFAAILAAAAIGANAECPNACSGQGTCGTNDACTCYDNWVGGDCSERVCPFGLGFVDAPVGDLDHDGAITKGDTATYLGATTDEKWQGGSSANGHFYTECSGKGSCDRTSGQCGCFDGYNGAACQRTTCPNDCSGHGQCFTLREIAAGSHHASKGRNYKVVDQSYGSTTTTGVSTTFDYNLWDADKNQACSCDKGYFGPDCSLRQCPKGDDPLTTTQCEDANGIGSAACVSEAQYVRLAHKTSATWSAYFEWADGEEYSDLLAGSLRSDVFTVREGLTGDGYASLVQSVLHSFPDGALNGVSVTCNAFYDSSGTAMLSAYTKCSTALNAADDVIELKVDFTNGPSGDVASLVSKSASGLNLATTGVGITVGSSSAATATTAGVAVGTNAAVTGFTGNTAIANGVTGSNTMSTGVAGNRENSVCSNRGICDFSTGECQCFSGYTREDCSKQSALAM